MPEHIGIQTRSRKTGSNADWMNVDFFLVGSTPLQATIRLASLAYLAAATAQEETMYSWMWEGLITGGEAAARWKGRGRKQGRGEVALSDIYGLQVAKRVIRQQMGNLRGVENSNMREPLCAPSSPQSPLALTGNPTSQLQPLPLLLALPLLLHHLLKKFSAIMRFSLRRLLLLMLRPTALRIISKK